jgi:hypothetical protein
LVGGEWGREKGEGGSGRRRASKNWKQENRKQGGSKSEVGGGSPF